MTSPTDPSLLRLYRRRFLSLTAASGCVASPALARVKSSASSGHSLFSPAVSSPAVHRGAQPPAPLIVLDPGHGGKDPGAIGYAGTYEKHISVATAAELRRHIMGTGRYRVALTRSEDHFIPLEGRVEFAQKHGAALFISMHADALHDHNVRGASVYTLSSRASDSQSAALATTENNADTFGGSHVHATSPEVQKILASLVSEETRSGSAHMAQAVVGSFRSRIALLSNPSRHAAFVVLKAADIPSVLVEMGFMSNPADETALRQSAHRTRIATAMCDAIDRYFATRPSGLQG
ncbi:N-acetylmuramoyl-L-alanine amidase [Acetobacter sp. AN02]|uniref:N-acetylmuramoyl-L-alanine amidase family protein n=1 Tax=Acetobacter sp. AN02 TaxID=2894186 RepID=UPI0024344A9C|nr:N-acetylmuramoyl-L-alanine amidase [Acetobacter sp. AN02]MDG6094109.1 N-acetylmuramoyl-L-alanine amidase [Acetobacter sp. AN02]